MMSRLLTEVGGSAATEDFFIHGVVSLEVFGILSSFLYRSKAFCRHCIPKPENCFFPDNPNQFVEIIQQNIQTHQADAGMADNPPT